MSALRLVHAEPGPRLAADAPQPVPAPVVVPIRCLIVDDHAAVRMGLRGLLEDDPRFTVIDAVATGDEAVGAATRARIDVAIVDWQLGGHSGLWVSRKLKRLPDPPAVLMYSAFADGALAAACVVAQADGLIGKQRVDIDLCDAICDVAAGMTRLPMLPPQLAQTMTQRLDHAEQAIFGMMRAGIPAEQIAQTLGLQRTELEGHLQAMVGKLEMLDAMR